MIWETTRIQTNEKDLHNKTKDFAKESSQTIVNSLVLN